MTPFCERFCFVNVIKCGTNKNMSFKNSKNSTMTFKEAPVARVETCFAGF